ncbi:Carbohydrate ABC transporter substrate-binding protein, CUT1 family [Bosea sp. 62]|uniref:extracellular solute-binding protein n=1 Tax=unclassified Bosea (in: a-proteobacteria) TaxID=2653178 RepID=UPI0012539911|nr:MULTISPECIES: extracellular solute-binding protein [unclassified Bosea (in: a-proteobacteria)]CAD5252233.1 Carbohydrate ABC transporter substrate-binding protein, CUT1 family [Bosea sp. 46]CAD5256911.1 Carbohydrate ABC transporter substrate-binding protein, CUT1 family [Bosea sp. 21B]CAD5284162.1 Carbohydrate ABC transporter substrate-binding protein, CUT1 family [Bosea sp. 7B]VVT56419.1 Carbohydrate ABC transporter substrate-binding protein, CUT1 family [Bosea sp. EC-HK365B]VXB33778.1 Carb
MKAILASAGAIALVLTASLAAAQDVNFLSTQLRPVEEAQKVRQVLLKGVPGKVSYLVEEPPQFDVRMKAEGKAGKRTISLAGALHGELQPLVTSGDIEPIDDLAAKLADRGIPQGLMELGKLGTGKQIYIPWMQATYIMVARKEALASLPAGADVNALTYDQLEAWGKALTEKTGKRLIGFPAGPKGLMPRFYQGYLYPSFTGGVVTPFRSAEAEAMWGKFKSLWQYVNPNSTSYDFMQEPLMAGEVWVAFDHVARLKDALVQEPDKYVSFPAPAGPKGRGYMPVVAGLAIPKGAPDRAGAAAVIEHLTKPEVQVKTAAEVGFFPVVKADLPADLSPGIKLIAEGVAKTQGAKDALPALLPIGLGDKGGEFNKVFSDSFQRIVLRGENPRTVLDAQAVVLKGLMETTKAPCWAPDKPSEGACPVN